jgi:protein ImuB
MFACLYRPPHAESAGGGARTGAAPGSAGHPADGGSPPSMADRDALMAIAREFSPRFELHHPGVFDLAVIDISGLERLLGTPRRVGEELRRTAAARGIHVQAALAATQTAAMMLARAQPGLTVIARGEEPDRLAPLPLEIFQKAAPPVSTFGPEPVVTVETIGMLKRWGLRTLGDLAALPPADLVARLGRPALTWQALARGEDIRPLIPALDEERFEGTLELEWPIEGLEPLSFVLTRLLEPLSTRLERRDRGAAVLHVRLGLITRADEGSGLRDVHARRLELPTPMRDVRSLRTLALLDLESHPPPAAIDRVTIVIDPTPGRVLQHGLFVRAHPTPEQISTLIARLNALMGQDRIGTPAPIDTYRPGAFTMVPFATEHSRRSVVGRDRPGLETPADDGPCGSTEVGAPAREADACLPGILRRCRQPVPARVTVAAERPVRVTTDRRGFPGGAVVRCAGPWRSSGNWWTAAPTGTTHPTCPPPSAHLAHWDHDEWDVSLSDGATYRLFRDRSRGAWFIEAIVD